MPDLTLHRLVWVVALVLAAATLVALRAPQLVDVSDQPTTFDGVQTMKSLRTLAIEHPNRIPGSGDDMRAAAWVATQAAALGLQINTDTFTATIAGRRVTLRNVWAVSKGETGGQSIVVLANRDSPAQSTQGADNNASGIAAVLELARVFSATAHAHPIVFVWTDGDAYGALGARDFVTRHHELDILGVVALRQVGAAGAGSVRLNGWAGSPAAAPPWLWVLARGAARSEGQLPAPLPSVVSQLLRLAAPASSGSQAPFVSAGVPALSLSASAPAVRPADDTVDRVSEETLTRLGRTAEAMVVSMDEGPTLTTRSGAQLFFSRYRRLSGAMATLGLLILTMPLFVMTGAAWVRALHRRQVPHVVSWLRLGLRTGPWLLTLAVVYLANLLSLLPRSPGALFPPESGIVQQPRYLRVALIVLLLAVTYHYAMAIERRLARRHPSQYETTVVVTLTAASAIAVLLALVNPFSLIFVVPCGALWPLARRGSWHRSRLPVWGALAIAAGAFVYFAVYLRVGWKVWWYFFLLIENHSIPALPVVLVIALIATTALLGHDLHRDPAGALGVRRGARRHRRPRRAARPLAAGCSSQTGGPPQGGPPV